MQIIKYSKSQWIITKYIIKLLAMTNDNYKKTDE